MERERSRPGAPGGRSDAAPAGAWPGKRTRTEMLGRRTRVPDDVQTPLSEQARQDGADEEADDEADEREPIGAAALVLKRGESERKLAAHVENDWAGVALLMRYLCGDGDLCLQDHPAWSSYMMSNSLLRRQVRDQIKEVAAERIALPAEFDAVTMPFCRQFHAEIESGEGVIGYFYLHGTNADVGDFQILGTSIVHRETGGVCTPDDPDGTQHPGETVVDLRLTCIWNDIIDAGDYGTDSFKDVIAEIISLGAAESYRLLISWSVETRVRFDLAGTYLDTEGWPGAPE